VDYLFNNVGGMVIELPDGGCWQSLNIELFSKLMWMGTHTQDLLSHNSGHYIHFL